MRTSEFGRHRPQFEGDRPIDWDGGKVRIDEGSPLISDPTWDALDGNYVYRRATPVASTSSLPEDDAARNELPMFDGLLAYFPNALAYVSTISKIGNEQHNPGEDLHWDRNKSKDHLNKIVRHAVDAGKKDARGVRHSGRLAWRALANLQEELEREEGAPLARGAISNADSHR